MPTIEVIDYGPFEIAVGSPAFERLKEQEKLPDFPDVREVEIVPDEPQVPADITGPGALSSLTRNQLNEHAASVGVEEPEKLNTKADVIAAVEAAQPGETLSG